MASRPFRASLGSRLRRAMAPKVSACLRQ
jgi:hypothetical protein